MAACLSLDGFAQSPIASVEMRLPTLEKSACGRSGDSFASLHEGVLSTAGYPARDEFRKPIPELVPKALAEAIVRRRQEFRQLYEASASSAGLLKSGDQILRDLSEEAQVFVQENFRAGKGRAVTPLMAFLTRRDGGLVWCLFYVLVADGDALQHSPTFIAERVGGDSLFVTIVGRDIDRSRLANTLAIAPFGAGVDNAIQCGPVSAQNLPSARR